MTKPRPYVRKASGRVIYLFLIAGFTTSSPAGCMHRRCLSSPPRSPQPQWSLSHRPAWGTSTTMAIKIWAVIALNSSNVSVLLGNGDGTFQPAETLLSARIAIPLS
jgi:hypothetical protein